MRADLGINLTIFRDDLSAFSLRRTSEESEGKGSTCERVGCERDSDEGKVEWSEGADDKEEETGRQEGHCHPHRESEAFRESPTQLRWKKFKQDGQDLPFLRLFDSLQETQRGMCES